MTIFPPSPDRALALFAQASALSTNVWLAIAIVVVLALIIASALMLRHWSRSAVDARIKQFRTTATALMERLDALKEQHKLLPVSDPDFKQSIQGETLGLYNRVQDELSQLWQGWLKLMDDLERAQKLMRDASAFGAKSVHEAEELVKPTAPFQELSARAEAVAADLDRLGQAHELARERRESLERERGVAAEQLKAIVEQGISNAPFLAEQREVAQLLERADACVTPDPLAATGLLDSAHEKCRKLSQRARDVIERSKEARGVIERIEETTRAIAEKRTGGLRLDEELGNPDVPLKQARVAQELAAQALNQGDPRAAAARVTEAETQAAIARKCIDQVEHAREQCGAELPKRREQAHVILAAIDRAAPDLITLEHNFAHDSWRDVANNLSTAKTTLAETNIQLDQAAESASPAAQRYLQAAAGIERVAALQADCEKRVHAVTDRRKSLESIREDCLRARDDLNSHTRALRDFIDREGPIIGPAARSALSDAVKDTQDSEIAQRDPRPNWPEIQRLMARAREGLAISRERAEADSAAYRQLQANLREQRQRADRVGQLLRSEDKDRPPANFRYRAACEMLDRIDRALNARNGDWADLARQLGDASQELDRSEQLAHEDIQFANRAIAEISEASRSVRGARGYSMLGATADTSAAQDSLDQAQRHLAAQEYEQAIELATNADHYAHAALNEAQRQANERQQQLEMERRRQAAEAMARQTGQLPTPGGIPPAAWIMVGQAAQVVLESLGNRGGGGAAGAHVPDSWSTPVEVPTGNQGADWTGAEGSWATGNDSAGAEGSWATDDNSGGAGGSW